MHFSRPAIDVLFETAASVYGARMLGILLTGASQDGALGIAAIRHHGGSTVVQKPEEAYAALMPRSALKQGPVDFVLSLEQIAGLLRNLNQGDGK